MNSTNPASPGQPTTELANVSSGNTVTIYFTAADMAFDTNLIEVPAGANVIINFYNRDRSGHNFPAYPDAARRNKIVVG